MNRKIRMGMVGGGPGSFIGGAHRRAANLDGKIELVAGCFSRDPAKGAITGAELFLDPERVYTDYKTMFEKEAQREDKIDLVSIVTPNAAHFEVAMAALDAGFDVICDKPMTTTLEQAKALADKVHSTGRLFALTHNYTAYPMVRQAKEMVKNGVLGDIRKIVVEYPQGWLADAVTDDNKQGKWRTDPALAGISCCMGDIGSHAENLAEFITGLEITELCADLTSFVPGRTLDDDGSVLLKFNNGARGILFASQIAVGEENALRIRIYGTKNALEWAQEDPETLTMRSNTGARQVMRRNWAGAGAAWSRLPAGHPEGFFEAFGNLYTDIANAIAARADGVEYTTSYPTVDDGVRGVAFIENVVKSSKTASKWIKFEV